MNCIQQLVALFSSWLGNADFYSYVQTGAPDNGTSLRKGAASSMGDVAATEEEPEAQETCRVPSLAELMAVAPSPEGYELESFVRERTPTAAKENPRLRELVKDVNSKHKSNRCGSVRNIYTSDLLASLDALNNYEDVIMPMDLPLSLSATQSYYVRCFNVRSRSFPEDQRCSLPSPLQSENTSNRRHLASGHDEVFASLSINISSPLRDTAMEGKSTHVWKSDN